MQLTNTTIPSAALTAAIAKVTSAKAKNHKLINIGFTSDEVGRVLDAMFKTLKCYNPQRGYYWVTRPDGYVGRVIIPTENVGGNLVPLKTNTKTQYKRLSPLATSDGKNLFQAIKDAGGDRSHYAMAVVAFNPTKGIGRLDEAGKFTPVTLGNGAKTYEMALPLASTSPILKDHFAKIGDVVAYWGASTGGLKPNAIGVAKVLQILGQPAHNPHMINVVQDVTPEVAVEETSTTPTLVGFELNLS